MVKGTIDRRRFLGLAGVSIASVIAGCADDPDDVDDGVPEDDGVDDTDDGVDDTDDEVDDTDDEVDDTDDDVDDTDDDVDEEDDDNEDDDLTDDAVLIVNVENEDGEPVTGDFTITIAHDEEPITYEFVEEIEEGRVEQILTEPGPHTVTVEGDNFDAVEESVTVEEGEEEEITITIEGAPGGDEANGEDEEENGEDENGEDENGEENGDGDGDEEEDE